MKKFVQLTLTVLLIASPALAGLTPVPEPSSMLLVGGGAAAIFLLMRKKGSRK